MIRLRQVALVASDLDPVVAELCAALGLDVCYVDPGVGEFGLHNALMLIGDQFLEVVSPTRDGTTAGRLLERRARDDGNGDGGYMAIYEVDDLDARVEHVQAAGVRVVWSVDLPTIRARHLHPRDVGGALVSIDQPAAARRVAVGRSDWRAHDGNGVVSAIAGVSIGAADPARDARGGGPSSVSTTPCSSSRRASGARGSTGSTSSPPTAHAPARRWSSAASSSVLSRPPRVTG